MQDTSKKNKAGNGSTVVNETLASAAGLTEHVGGSVTQAARIYAEAAQHTSDNLRAVAEACSTVGTEGAQRMQSAWADWLTRTFETNRRASQELLRCRTLQDMAEVHRDLLRESTEEWLNGSAQVLRISSEIAAAAVRPIEERAGRQK